MLEDHGMGLFRESIMDEFEKDILIDEYLFEAESDLFELENEYYSESAGDTLKKVWDTIKETIKTILEKISSVVRKKAIKEVDMKKDVMVDKGMFGTIKRVLGAIKKVFSAGADKIKEALTGKHSTLFMVISIITGASIGAMVIGTHNHNAQVQLRNSMRIKKVILNESIAVAENELKNADKFIDKFKNDSSKAKTIEGIKQASAKVNDSIRATKNEMKDTENSFKKIGKDINVFEDDISCMQYAAQFMRKVVSVLNSIIKSLTSALFAKPVSE